MFWPFGRKARLHRVQRFEMRNFETRTRGNPAPPSLARRVVWQRVSLSRRWAIAVARVRYPRPPSFAAVSQGVQPKMVKIYGRRRRRRPGSVSDRIPDLAQRACADRVELRAGQRRGHGHVGRWSRLDAQLVGADPRLEIAILKVNAEDLPHFKLDERGTAGR